MPDPQPIRLSQERYAELIEAERQLALLHSEFDKAEECGIDCQQLRATQAEAIQRIQSMRKNYAPLTAKA